MRTDVSGWTDTQLFDYLQNNLGLGTYNPASGEAFQLWRARQIGMLKAIRTRRGVTFGHFVLCADYCKAHKVTATTYGAVLRYSMEAREWEKATRPQQGLPQEILDAVAYERGLSDDTTWVDQLLRSSPLNRAGVLERWRLSRNLLV